MAIYYRKLTPNDKDQLIELFESNPTVYTKFTDKDFQEKFKNILANELLNPLCFFPSIFINDKLYVTIYLKESPEAPSWIWAHHMHRTASFTTFVQPEFIDAAMELDTAIYDEMAIKRKLNRFYFVFPVDEKTSTRSIGSVDRIYTFMKKVRNYDSNFSKYEIYTDCIVEKNTMPRYNYQKKLIGDRTWPFDLAVRIGMLKG